MRALMVITDSLFPAAHGGAKCMRALAEALAAHGHDITVAIKVHPTPVASGPAVQTVGALIERCTTSVLAPRSPVDFRVAAVRYVGVPAASWADEVAALVRRLEPQVIVAADDALRDGASVLTNILAFSNVPVALFGWTLTGLPDGPVTAVRDRRATDAFGRVDCVLVPSDYAARYVRRWSGRDATTVCLPVFGTGPFPSLSDKSGPVMLLNPCDVKGLPILIDLARDLLDVPFVVVPGWGTTDRDLELLATLPNVRIVAGRDDIAEVLAGASAVLFPSLWEETFPLVPIEAMLHGIPVLGGDLGGVPAAMLGMEFVLPVRPLERVHVSAGRKSVARWLIPPQDVAPWSRALRAIRGPGGRHADLSQHGSSAARSYVTSLSWAPVLDRLAELAARGRRPGVNAGRVISTPSPPDAQEWWVLSRLVGMLDLGDGRFIAAHAFARTRVVGDEAVAAILQWFAVPRSPRELFESEHEELGELGHVLRQLRASGLLRAAGNQELERVRRFYRRRLPVSPVPTLVVGPSRSTGPVRSLLAGGGYAPTELVQLPGLDGALVLSSAVTVVELDDGEVLATHPLHTPVHMTAELWAFVLEFVVPLTLQEAIDRFVKRGLTPDAVVHLCGWLRRRFLLWSSRPVEIERCRALAGEPNLRSLLVEYPAAQRWRQIFEPYSVADVVHCRAAGTVALIGPCQIQLAAEALQVLAQRAGIYLDVVGVLDPTDPALESHRWSAVVLSGTQHAAALYEAIAAEDDSRMIRLATAVATRIDETIDAVRARTSAPLFVTSISPPGLAPSGAESAFWHRTKSVLASLNTQLAERLELMGNAWLLDEAQLAADASPGVYWDDEFNALPHHSAISSWSWLITKPGLTDGDPENDPPRPPAGPGQRDPAVALGAGLAHAMERLAVETPVHLVVFDPDDLLWRGKIADRETAFPTPPHFYADVEDYLYVGIHEALSVLRRQGVLLAAAPSCPPDVLRLRWHTPSTLEHLVRIDDVVALASGFTWSERLRDLSERLGIAEEEMLVIGCHPGALGGFKGRVFTGDRYSLRRFLLREPALHPLSGGPHRSHQRPNPPPGASAPAWENPTAHNRENLDETVATVVANVLRMSPDAIIRSKDLRHVGLDSLGVIQMASALEERFDIRFGDQEFVEPVMYFLPALCRAVREALQKGNAAWSQPMAATDDSFGGRNYDEWCRGDVGSLIASHIESPGVPWIFKVVESPAPFDARYLTWKELGRLAGGYAHALTRVAPNGGIRVGVAMENGAGLIGACAGALLSRFVPLVLPPLPANAEALRSVLDHLHPQVIMCSDEGLEALTKSLRAAGFDGSVIAGEGPRQPVRPDPRHTQSREPLLVQQTSGTTRARRVLELDDQRLLSQLWQIGHALECNPNDRIATWLPMYHDMGFICTLMLPLVLSVPTVIMSPTHWVQHPDMLLREVSAEHVSLGWMPNFAFAHTARRVSEQSLDNINLSSLRVLVNGGEPVTATAMDAFARRFAAYGLRGSALTAGYGAAEATAAITQSRPGQPARRLRLDRRELEERGVAKIALPDATSRDVLVVISSGPPLERTRVWVVDMTGREVPDGTLGNLVIEGDSVASKYEDDAKASTASFRDGCFHTRDLGFVLDGEVFVIGRSDDLIVAAGRNVFPHLLEEAASQVPGVQPGRVVAIGIPVADGSTQQVVVLVEPADESLSAVQQADLMEAAATAIFATTGVTASVRLVPPGSLIKSSSGKPSRSRNRILYIKCTAANQTGAP